VEISVCDVVGVLDGITVNYAAGALVQLSSVGDVVGTQVSIADGVIMCALMGLLLVMWRVL
jgi:hypothetical protein